MIRRRLHTLTLTVFVIDFCSLDESLRLQVKNIHEEGMCAVQATRSRLEISIPFEALLLDHQKEHINLLHLAVTNGPWTTNATLNLNFQFIDQPLHCCYQIFQVCVARWTSQIGRCFSFVGQFQSISKRNTF